MAVISTTGQGQGAAQVVKQRPSQMGTIVSSFVDDYLAEQAEKAKAEQEAEAARYKASLMQGKLKGAFKGKSDAIKNEIDKKVKKGEISPTAGGEILMGQVEELVSKQDAFIKGISSPNKTFSYSSDGSFDPNPTLSMYNNLFGDEAEQNGLNDFNKVLEQNEALLLRAEEKPKKDLVEIYRTEFMPLVKDMYKINIDESLSEEEQNKIIKTTIKSLSSEDQQVIIDRFSENEDVIKNIILQSPNEAQTITENGVVLNMPFINKESEKFAKSFLGIRQTVSEDIQKTGKKKGGFRFTGGGSAENDLFSFSLSDKEGERSLDMSLGVLGKPKYKEKSYEVSITPKEGVSMGSKTSAKFTVGDEVISGTPTKIIGKGDDIKVQFISKLEYGNGEEIRTVNYDDIETQMNDRYGLSRDVINKIVNGEEGEEDANRSESAKEKEQGQTSKESSQPEIGTSSDLP
jgi:hypothetical protein